jgi:hypothetical protein
MLIDFHFAAISFRFHFRHFHISWWADTQAHEIAARLITSRTGQQRQAADRSRYITDRATSHLMSLFSLPPLPPDTIRHAASFSMCRWRFAITPLIFAFRYWFHCHAIIISFSLFRRYFAIISFSLPLFSLFSFRCHYADAIIFGYAIISPRHFDTLSLSRYFSLRRFRFFIISYCFHFLCYAIIAVFRLFHTLIVCHY